MGTNVANAVEIDDLGAVGSHRTVTEAFRDTVRDRGQLVALRWRDNGEWRTWTWSEYAERAARVAAGLRDLGVERGERVLLMMRNRPEFHIADMAALLIGATPFSIYNSSAPEQVEFLARHSSATVAVVETPALLERFLGVRANLPSLRHIVIVDDPDSQAPADVVHFERLLQRPPIDWEAAAAGAHPDDLVTMIYTSGTTGPPKGVMLTHRNACWTVQSLLRALARDVVGKRFVSYLPMAHIAERMASHYIHVDQGTEVSTCLNPARIAEYLREVRPQIFFAVPRVWEKAHSTIEALAAGDPEKVDSFRAAIELGRRAATARMNGEQLDAATQAAWEDAERDLLSVIRLMIGLDECEVAVSAAAPLPPSIMEFFLAIGVPISELYGLSESCGPVAWDPAHPRPGTVGRPIPGCEVRFAPDGEILVQGGNVFVGYLDEPAKTAEALDADGWLHTGDVGMFERDQLRVVDRKKELIVTSGGENISPANLEGMLRSAELVGQACVIGEGREYLVALITLDPEVTLAWARARGMDHGSLADLASDSVVRAELRSAIHEINAGLSRASHIQRFAVLGHEWPPDSDELTATMKLRRQQIHAKYAIEIEALYGPDHETI